MSFVQHGLEKTHHTWCVFSKQLQHVQVTVTGNSWLRKEKWSVDFARGNDTKHIHAIFCHDYPLAVEPASTPRPLVQKRDSLPIDMLLSAVSVLVVVQSSSEIPEGLMNNPVYTYRAGGDEAVSNCRAVRLWVALVLQCRLHSVAIFFLVAASCRSVCLL
jgi:hypothetical protein